MDYATWQKKIHTLAVEKGWWEKHSNPLDRAVEAAVLIVTELSEAIEAYREGRMKIETSDITGKPEGFPIEIADAVIRALDLAGVLVSANQAEDLDAAGARTWFRDALLDTAATIDRDQAASHDVMSCVAAAMRCALIDFDEPGTIMLYTVGGVLFWCERIAQVAGFDLEEAIQIKHAYNATRPYRHGGKLA